MRTKSSFTGSETLMALTLLISLAALFCTRGTAFASSPEVSSLLSSPVPFYHDYNLAAMFPVGTGAGEKEGEPGAGGAISLDRCIDIALGMNPGFQKSHQNVRATTGDILAAWGEYMPTLSTSFGISQSNRTYSYVDPSGKIRVGGGISKSSYTSLNLNYTLFDRAAKYFRMKNAYYLRDTRRSQLRSARLDLVNQVRRAYFDMLRQEKLIDSARRSADELQEQLRLAEARFSVGSVTKLDVMQAKIDLQNQKLVIIQYENALLAAGMDLNRVMGTDIKSQLVLEGEFSIREPVFDVEKQVAEAIDGHPDIRSLELQVKQEEGNLWMGRLAYLPRVFTSASYSRSTDFLTINPNDQKGRGLRVNMSWNIIDSFNRFRQNRSTEVSLHNLRYDLATRRLDIERDVRQSYLELLRQFQRNIALSESRNLAASSLELERERYRLGASSLLDMRRAQVDYDKAEVDYINSIYDFQDALSNLSRNVGRDISLEY